MLETKKLLKNAMSRVDAVLEILDARLPHASSNPLLDQLCKETFRLKVLNKSDLADPESTQKWIDFFEQSNHTPAVSICGTQPEPVKTALDYCTDQIRRNRARKIKIMVVGIPNTGKSTILNSLAGKKIAKTGNVPAVTRHQQRTSLADNIDIYDTPGILWPLIEPRKRAYLLAASGAISDTAIDYTDLAIFIAPFLIHTYPDLLNKRYPFLRSVPQTGTELIERIGAARGCLKKGGQVDLQKASEVLIRELRAGKIGPISFETPEDIDYEP